MVLLLSIWHYNGLVGVAATDWWRSPDFPLNLYKRVPNMKMKNFKRVPLLVISTTGHSIRFAAGEEREVLPSLVSMCLSEGLVPLDDIAAALHDDVVLLKKEEAEASLASTEADVEEAEKVSAALKQATIDAEEALRLKRSAVDVAEAEKVSAALNQVTIDAEEALRLKRSAAAIKGAATRAAKASASAKSS